MTRRDRADLLTCPFCGGFATEEITQEHTANPKYRVLCMNCGCSTPKTVCTPIHIRTWNRVPKGTDECSRCRFWEGRLCKLDSNADSDGKMGEFCPKEM